MSTTPRAAESRDDLRVGQVVASRFTPSSEFAGQWSIAQPVTSADHAADICRDSDLVVILSDPPPEPVTVSREAFDRLARAVTLTRQYGSELPAVARALVDEVRQAES